MTYISFERSIRKSTAHPFQYQLICSKIRTHPVRSPFWLWIFASSSNCKCVRRSRVWLRSNRAYQRPCCVARVRPIVDGFHGYRRFCVRRPCDRVPIRPVAISWPGCRWSLRFELRRWPLVRWTVVATMPTTTMVNYWLTMTSLRRIVTGDLAVDRTIKSYWLSVRGAPIFCFVIATG